METPFDHVLANRALNVPQTSPASRATVARYPLGNANQQHLQAQINNEHDQAADSAQALFAFRSQPFYIKLVSELVDNIIET